MKSKKVLRVQSSITPKEQMVFSESQGRFILRLGSDGRPARLKANPAHNPAPDFSIRPMLM